MWRYIKEIDIILIFGIEIQLIINKKYRDLTSAILGDHFNSVMVALPLGSNKTIYNSCGINELCLWLCPMSIFDTYRGTL